MVSLDKVAVHLISNFFILFFTEIKTDTGCGEMTVQCPTDYFINIEGLTWRAHVCERLVFPGVVSCCPPNGWSQCSSYLGVDDERLTGVRTICDGQHHCTIGIRPDRICITQQQHRYAINYQTVNYTCSLQSNLSMYMLLLHKMWYLVL